MQHLMTYRHTRFMRLRLCVAQACMRTDFGVNIHVCRDMGFQNQMISYSLGLQETMPHIFITLFVSLPTILVARSPHGSCVAPVLLQKQQALPLA